MNVDFKGYAESVATFMKDSTVNEGTLVTMSDSFTVTACTSGDEILGLCVGVRGDYASVQLSGYTEVPTSGEIAVGFKGISAADDTTVAADDTAKKYHVIYSDNDTVGFIL